MAAPAKHSVRGVAAIKEIGNEPGLHVFDCSNFGSTCMRSLLE
jgi:hypothetical protein